MCDQQLKEKIKGYQSGLSDAKTDLDDQMTLAPSAIVADEPASDIESEGGNTKDSANLMRWLSPKTKRSDKPTIRWRSTNRRP